MTTVAALWRYPVKSLQGVTLDALELTADGPVGDRAYAVVRDGRPLSAKRGAELLLARAALDGVEVTISLPDGTAITGPGVEADAALSRWLGAEVTLVGHDHHPWVDDAPVHLLTTASLAAMRARRPGDWDARRFRPNIVVEADGRGFPEEAWVGRRLRVGDTLLDVRTRTVRCAMTGHAQPGLPADGDVLRTLGWTNDTSLGVYAEVVEGGTVRVGDPVEVDP